MTMMRKPVLLGCALLLLLPVFAFAEGVPELYPAAHARDPWRVCWTDQCAPMSDASTSTPQLQIPFTLPVLADASADDAQRARPVVIEYSDAYRTRRKIHKIASFATLPLFGAELWLGQNMYNNTPTDQSSKRGWHAAIGAGIVGLFGVNTVTGAWNLFGEGRKDPHGRTLRLIHGLLMMTSDVGMLATTMSGPNSRSVRHALTYEADKAHHRNLAIFSISTGTAGYLLMLFGNR